MLWRKGHYWRRSAPRARNDADHDLLPVAVLAGCKDPGYGQMISAVECREHAVECRQMSERAPSLRVRDILIDMARGWERLALVYCGPVLRHPAGPIQAANFRSAIAF
jgi:hypothetical protein